MYEKLVLGWGEGAVARNREGGRQVLSPEMGGTGRGDLRGSYSCPTVDNQYVCYVRFFTPLCFGSGF